MTSDSTGWPLSEERAPLGHVRHASKPRRRAAGSRPAWLLAALAFICGALVSAAVFTVGWRHQAQRNTAAESALVKETSRNHTLAASLAAARAATQRERRIATAARGAARRLARAGAAIAAEAGVSSSSAGSLGAGATGVASQIAKLASELKTLTTYLTTTPPSQLDSGYIQSQASYLARQMGKLQGDGSSLGGAVTSFDAAAAKLTRLASALDPSS